MKVAINKVIAVLLTIFTLANSVEQSLMRCFATPDPQKNENHILADGVYEILFGLGLRNTITVTPNSEQEVSICKNRGSRPREKFCFKYDAEKDSYTVRSMYNEKYLGVEKSKLAKGIVTLNSTDDECYNEWIVKPRDRGFSLELKTESEKLLGIGVEMDGQEIKEGSLFKLTNNEVEKLVVRFNSERSLNGIYEITSPALCKKRYSVFDAATIDTKTGFGLSAFLRNGYGTQKFCIRYHSDTDDYEIMSMSPRMFLGVQKDSEETAKLICKETTENSDNFRWEIIRLSDGYVKIKSKSSELFLEVGGTSLFKRTEILLRTGQDCSEQKFMFNNICESTYALCQVSPLSDQSKIVVANQIGLQSEERNVPFAIKNCLTVSFDLDDRCCRIINPINGKCLGTRDGEQIEELDCLNEDEQKWVPLKFKNSKGESFVFMLKSSIWTEPIYMYFKDPQTVCLSNEDFKPKTGRYSFNVDWINKDSLSLEDKGIFLDSVSKSRKPKEKEQTRVIKNAETEEPFVAEEKGQLTKTEPEAQISNDGLSVEDIVTVQSEFGKYKSYVETISQRIEDPNCQFDDSIFYNKDTSLETISKKLAYVCSKILKAGTEKALKPHNVQLFAAMRLIESVLSPEDGMKGSIGNIRTGEGKSFIITLVAIVLQSYGQKLDIITSNMELATRDWKEQKFYYDLFNISSGFLYNRFSDKDFGDPENDVDFGKENVPEYNTEVLEKDIVYSTHANFQWLYLKNIPFENTMRNATGIVDEADHAMLDGAVDPVLLANGFNVENATKILVSAYNIATSGKNEIEMRQILSNKFPDAKFTEKNVKVLFDAANKAQESVNGKDYIVRDVEDPTTGTPTKKVQIIDKSTGFVLNDSRWSAYIHEMIEIKEGIDPKRQTVAQSTISPMIFLNAYQRLIGVTGSVGDEDDIETYKKLYQISAFDVPTNLEIKRDVLLKVYEEDNGLEESIAKEALAESEKGRPVLIILESVKATSDMKARYLPNANLIQGIDPQADKESIKVAGQSKTITVSTIAAGRGTNIKLSQKAFDAGGLHVIIAHLPQQSRTLIQNIGRSSRQGQPGSATVFVKYGEQFQGGKPLRLGTINLFKLQEKFITDLVNLWPWMLSMKQRFTNPASYKFGFETDDILNVNAETIADKLFWPNCEMSDTMFTEYINSIYHMLFAAWGEMYSRLEFTKDSEDFDKCVQAYNEMMMSVFKWIPKDCNDPGNLLKDWAHRTGVDQKVFDLLYTHKENETIYAFINRLINTKKVQASARSAGVNIKNFDEMVKFLPLEHQKAYEEYCQARREYDQSMEEYHRKIELCKLREFERKNIARANEQLYNKMRDEQIRSEVQISEIEAAELERSRAQQAQQTNKPTPKQEYKPADPLPEEPSKPEYHEPESGNNWDIFGGILDIFGGMKVSACEPETEQPEPPEKKEGFWKSAWHGACKVVEGIVGGILDVTSTKVYAPGPEQNSGTIIGPSPCSLLSYEDVAEVEDQILQACERGVKMPTKEEVREILKGRIEEYERQLKPLPESLPYPDLPPEPDWEKIGWHHFNGANFQNCVLSRFIAPNLVSYVSSPYCNKRKVLSGEEVHKLDLLSDIQLNRLSQEILNRVRAKRTCKIDWGKVGKVAVIVACGAGFVALTVASAGTVAIGAGATAASLGASSAVVSTVSTAATIGTYTVAGGIAATTVCDAEEVITDGHNTIRDNMIAPLAGQEHASEIYNNSKLMLTLASLGITQFAADNAQFRPLPKNKNLQAQIKPNLEPKSRADLKLQNENELNSKTLLKPDIQSFVEEAETEVEAELESMAGGEIDFNWTPSNSENSANDIIQYEKLKSQYAANEILNADRIGSSLKEDPSHRAASYLSKEQLSSGRTCSFRGGDNRIYKLLQTKGQLDGKDGIYEYVINDEGQVTHQRFIKGGIFTGFPNQNIKK